MKIAVVIPSYKVAAHIGDVIARIGKEVDRIFVVDDACPEQSGDYAARVGDARVRVLRHEKNQGVGGAVITGYKAALEEHMDIVVKLDGDGQMDPSLISRMTAPIMASQADYTKGNRFYYPRDARGMPLLRWFGNICLSFLTKLSSGYWNLFDPTNGFTAIHARVLRTLPFSKISHRYFFESDMLFRLYNARAAILEIPLHAHYGEEKSSLRIRHILLPFLAGHTRNFFKRIFYHYYLRNFSIASLELLLGSVLFTFGMVTGFANWMHSINTGQVASAGTVMLAALPIILGFQMLLSFINYDIASVPTTPIAPRLPEK